MESYRKLDPLMKEFGELFHTWGLKKVHGEIWATIYISGKALSAKDLIERLGISKALVSISMRKLLKFEIVRRDYSVHEKVKFYIASENILKLAAEMIRERERYFLSLIQKNCRDVLQMPDQKLALLNVDPEKIAELEKMSRKF